MAKQKGIIRFKGNLGGISFYESNGEDLTRIANGPDKNKILTSPNFVRTRENNQEFGGAAVIGKAFRVGLAQVFAHMSDSRATARVVKLIKDMMNKSDGLRGQRGFTPVSLGSMMVNFPFSNQLSFDSIMLAPFSTAVNAERTAVTLTIPDFHTGNMLHAARGATHFRLVNAVTVLSEFQFNTDIKAYEPTDSANSGKNGLTFSEYIPIGGQVGVTNNLVTTVPELNGMLDSTALICCVGIEFYQDINGSKYLLSTDNAMKVQAVY